MQRWRRPVPARAATVMATCLVAAVLVPVSGTAAHASPDGDGRQHTYAEAAARHGVPERVLLALAYIESRWNFNAGAPSSAGGHGSMHLTDLARVTAATAVESTGDAQGAPGGDLQVGPRGDVQGDPRGDDSRPAKAVSRPSTRNAVAEAVASGTTEEGTRTLATAAGLLGVDAEQVRTDPVANINAGAALLARYQRELRQPVGADSDPARWYGAVARYSTAASLPAAREFADEVYDVLATGAEQTTDEGYTVRLAAGAVTPDTAQADRLGLPNGRGSTGTECPRRLRCEWVGAPYQLLGDGSDPGWYGNYDVADRPRQQKIEYIVIHDVEGSYGSALDAVRNPEYISWQYTIRSSDGHVAQHVKAKDIAWQAGNWYLNAKSIGIEHEGYAADATWYTEAMYRASAKLVRYLADRYDVPLDRAHVIGHDNVPGPTPSYVPGMHWDPGPYWDWAHYFKLLGKPLHATGPASSELVTIRPTYDTNTPAFTGCAGAATDPCPAHGSSEVILRTAPSDDAPLVTDAGLHPDGSPATMRISDHGARASTGQRYAVAGRSGDWIAIWYLGQRAWLRNSAAVPATGKVATPKAGRASIPVYGRAYPEAAAYPAAVAVQSIVPLQYTLPAGQRYSVGAVLPSEYYQAWTFDGSASGDRTLVRGQTRYVQIQFGHRLMYVNADDVDLR